jgi:hypothetical protein
MSAPAVGVDYVDGVPVTAIAVVGMGEKGLLVPTPDGVREPQDRRVEIVSSSASSALRSRCGKVKCHTT